MARQGERLVGARARSFRVVNVVITLVALVLGVITSQWWLVVFASAFVVYWALQIRAHVRWDGERIVVQNPIRRFEVRPAQVEYVDGTIRLWRRSPYFVLRDGRRISISAYGTQSWFLPENRDAAELAETLHLPFEAD